MEFGTEAAQFPSWEYLFQRFGIVSLKILMTAFSGTSHWDNKRPKLAVAVLIKMFHCVKEQRDSQIFANDNNV